jgi:hypothetical protein
VLTSQLLRACFLASTASIPASPAAIQSLPLTVQPLLLSVLFLCFFSSFPFIFASDLFYCENKQKNTFLQLLSETSFSLPFRYAAKMTGAPKALFCERLTQRNHAM